MKGRPSWRAALVVTLLAGSGCAIQADSGPRDVPEDHPARGDLPSGGVGAEATGEGRIYLLAPGERDQPLRTVLRPAEQAQQLIQTLVDGPNETEVRAGLRSELPLALEVLSVRVGDGVVQVDLSDDILELQGRQLTLAVAQIVFTASEIPGADSVVIRVDGETRAWPNGSNEQQTSPLTVYDFIDYAQSAQPAYPVTPTPRALPPGASAATTTTSVVPSSTTAESATAESTTAESTTAESTSEESTTEQDTTSGGTEPSTSPPTTD